jgi:Protein kinase domain
MSALAVPRVAQKSPSTLRPEHRLNAVIAEYLEAAQAGRAPDRREYLERYWDLANGLMSFFANEDSLKRLAVLPRRPVAEESRARTLRLSVGPGPEVATRRVFGEFELLSEIASGGMGIVYKARHRRLNRVVAVKTLKPGALRPSRDMVSRLRMEAKVVAALDHPNIVPLYDIGEQGGYPYLVLKLFPCGDLDRHLLRFSRNPRAAARLLARVARAVHYAHLQGVLHCDLKPSNILLDPQGAPHVTDFGLAKCVATESGLTRTGLILGTPAYMAPEQVSGRRREMTAAVDVYGLGAVLYKLLTGSPPFQAEALYELLDQVRDCKPIPVREHNPRIHRDLEAICLKCLEKDPGRRYHSAAALAVDLDRWRSGAAITARPLGRWERAWRWYHQNRLVVAISAALVTLVMIFALAAVATATIICQYGLSDEAPRTAAQGAGPTRRWDGRTQPGIGHRDGWPAAPRGPDGGIRSEADR